MEDRLYSLKTRYQNLSPMMRNALGCVFSVLPTRIRYGPFYGQYRARIRSFCACHSPEQIQSMQLDLLRRTVQCAVQHVPFYRGYHPITTAEDLRVFPIVDKNMLSERQDNFLASAFRRYALPANTGGSSGTPLSFYLHRGLSRPKEKAHFDWFWQQFGYRKGARVLTVRGAPLRNNALYEYQAIDNRLAVSCYEVNEASIKEVVEAIRAFKPEFIHAYPSALESLTRLIGDPKPIRDRVRIKTIFLGSEGIDPTNRAFLSTFYETRVVSWYGHSECAVHAGNAVDSDEFHFYPFYGYVELLDESDRPLTRPGDRGRIVATSFDNFVMPFIRYDTGDIGVLSERMAWRDELPCTVLKQIEGRAQDYIVLQDGTRVSVTAFIFGQHLPQFSAIREMQLQQDRRGELLVRVIPLSTIAPEDFMEMGCILRKSVSGQLSVRFEVVNQIAKTHRGKHRFLIQNLAEDLRSPRMQLREGASGGSQNMRQS